MILKEFILFYYTYFKNLTESSLNKFYLSQDHPRHYPTYFSIPRTSCTVTPRPRPIFSHFSPCPSFGTKEISKENSTKNGSTVMSNRAKGKKYWQLKCESGVVQQQYFRKKASSCWSYTACRCRWPCGSIHPQSLNSRALQYCTSLGDNREVSYRGCCKYYLYTGNLNKNPIEFSFFEKLQKNIGEE